MNTPKFTDEADLSFRVSKGGQKVERINEVPLRIPLPWPMTRAGGIVFVLVEFALIICGIAGALWVGWQLFEPSLLRLSPAVAFALAVKFAVIPLLRKLGQRPGMDRR